jgi:hypothetical protein
LVDSYGWWVLESDYWILKQRCWQKQNIPNYLHLEFLIKLILCFTILE